MAKSDVDVDVDVNLDTFDFEENPSRDFTFYMPEHRRGKMVGHHHKVLSDGTIKVSCSRQQLGPVGRLLLTFGAKMQPWEECHPGFKGKVAGAKAEAKSEKAPVKDDKAEK